MGTKSGLLHSGLLGGQAGYGWNNAEAQAVAAAFTVGPSGARAPLMDNLVGALKTAGVWTLLDALYMLAAADSQAALINWKTPGTFNGVAINSPPFTIDRGFASNGSSSYVDSTITPSTIVGNWLVNSAHASAWSLTQRAAADVVLLGCVAGAPTRFVEISARLTGDAARGLVNSPGIVNPTNTVTAGLFFANRSAAGAQQLYRNTTDLAEQNVASSGLSTFPISICARNNQGTLDRFSTDVIAEVSFGGSLNATQEAAFYNAVLPYLQAVGAA